MMPTAILFPGLTNTVILETKDGTINNHGTISLEDTAQNSVALKLTGSGSINNKNGGIINVGTKTAGSIRRKRQ